MAKIPIDIDNKTNVIVLKILLKGKRDFRMIKMVLDTGASISTIPTETALAIGCDPAKAKKRIEMITASGTEYVPVVIIPEIRFLGFSLRNIETACLNLPPQSAVSGLLGLNVLRHFDILLKFRSKILEVTK
jgi:clan AA aspartic protease (TIGR02281 family)